MSNVVIDRTNLDYLANAISCKSGEAVPMTITEMVSAVDGISTGGTPTLETVTKTYTPSTSAVTDTITASAGYDGIEEVDVTVSAVPSAQYTLGTSVEFRTVNGSRKWRMRGNETVETAGYKDVGFNTGSWISYNAIATGTTVTPTTSSQTIGGANYMMEGAVTVNAMPSGSATPAATISATGASVSTGTNTLTLSKTVNNTPQVASGYISSGTAGNSSVSLTASVNTRSSSDLSASGATVTAPAGYYASAASKSVASGTEGTPTATKGAVNNHAISVTPSVTNSAGYISGSTKTGTAVTVTASELASGNKSITSNGNNIDVVGYSTVSVNVSGGGGGGSSMVVATATKTLTSAASSIQFTGLSGEPTSFAVTSASDQTTGGTKAVAVVYDGTSCHGMDVTTQAEADTGFTQSYSSGTLTITATTAAFQANEYKLVYTYGGTAANIGTEDVQVGSGATSITFTGLSDDPDYFSCIFKSTFSTSSGYQRVISVVYDGTNTYGLAMDSGAKAQTSWSYSYNNGSLTITSTGTNNGGYFHQPGYYQLTYGVGGDSTLQKKTATPTSLDQTITADTAQGYTALSQVKVEGVVCDNLTAGNIKSGVVVKIGTATDDDSVTSVTGTYSGGGGGSASIDTKTLTASNRPSSLSFSSMKGEPIAWYLKATFTMTSSSSTYYYVDSMRYNGTNTQGRCFQMGSTRQTLHVTSGYSYTYNNGTLTVSSTGNRTTSPGCFYNGSYELVYIY